MTLNNIKEKATINAQQENDGLTKKRVKSANQNQPKEIIKVLDISKDVILEYYKYASKQDKEWIKKRSSELIEQRGNRGYFAPFRSEFAKKYFPELCTKKDARRKSSILDDFDAIDNAC